MSWVHEVSISVGGDDPVTFDGVQDLDLTMDMLELADQFSFRIPFDLDAWDTLRTDAEVEILIDDSTVLNGYIDRREKDSSSSGSMIRVSGRDKGGRVVDESAPLTSLTRLSLDTLTQRMVDPWFPMVSLSNARNRRLIGGRGRAQARTSREPPIALPKDVSRKVEPGDTRAQVLQEFLEKARLLAWSSADGLEFIVGRPNYDQEAQFRFFWAAENSSRASEVNVLSANYVEDVGEQYSEYHVCGASRGDGVNYGRNVTRRAASSFDHPSSDGTGGMFLHPKRTIISDSDVRSAKHAQDRADREKAVRFASAREFSVSCDGWGQPFEGRGFPVLFGFDKVAKFEDEELDLEADVLITRVNLRETKSGGQTATISMVPVGTELIFS